MRLLTHNSLCNNSKDVTLGYPLALEVSEMKVSETPCNHAFIQKMLGSLNWPVLKQAAHIVGIDALPDSITDDLFEDEEFLSALHHVLLNIDVIEGVLICPESGMRFPIINGIPNMIPSESTDNDEQK